LVSQVYRHRPALSTVFFIDRTGGRVRNLARVIHVQPTAALAARVLLPGDPGRALRLATALIDGPKMFNHNRGLWGYTGTAHDGELLTIQSTGMGGPSIAIVVHELIELGARTLLRVGTCGGLAEPLELGQVVIATEALAADGTSRALGAPDRVPASPALVAALLATAPNGAGAASGAIASGPIVTTDLFYDERDPEPGWRDAGAIAVEMESSVLFTIAAKRRIAAATVLVVSDRLFGARERIGRDELELAELELGRIAMSGLAIHATPEPQLEPEI
jgi:DeoD family purine-nucleoside phosphorylase